MDNYPHPLDGTDDELPSLYRTRRGTWMYACEENIETTDMNMFQNTTSPEREPNIPPIASTFGGDFYGDTDPQTAIPNRRGK